MQGSDISSGLCESASTIIYTCLAKQIKAMGDFEYCCRDILYAETKIMFRTCLSTVYYLSCTQRICMTCCSLFNDRQKNSCMIVPFFCTVCPPLPPLGVHHHCHHNCSRLTFLLSWPHCCGCGITLSTLQLCPTTVISSLYIWY